MRQMRCTREHIGRTQYQRELKISRQVNLVLPPLPDKRYDIAYVDPPWQYYGSAVKDAAAAKHYPLMPLEELAAIDVRRMLNARAAV